MLQLLVLKKNFIFRPLLVYLTGEALAGDMATLDLPACAIELIHNYSLVHDDLPAMDNDDLRRGKPTCHKAYDEATAILATYALIAAGYDQIRKNAQILKQVGVQKADTICVLALENATHNTGIFGDKYENT